MYSPFTKIIYIQSFPSISLEQFLRAIWGAVSQAAVLILPQIKLNFNSQVVYFFLSWQPHTYSVQFSCSVLSDTLQFHGLQHARFPYPLTNSQSWLILMSITLAMPPNHLIFCHPLLLLPSIFPSIRVFSNESLLHIRWPNIGISASASVLPMNIQDRFPLGLTGLISLHSKGLLRVFFNTAIQKHQFFSAQPSSQSNSHIHTWPQEKP